MLFLFAQLESSVASNEIHDQVARQSIWSRMWLFYVGRVIVFALSFLGGIAVAGPSSIVELPDQLRVPMPRGQSMEFRAVIVASERTELELGSTEQSKFVDAMRSETIIGSFQRQGQNGTEWLYYIGVHEVTEQQWSAILGAEDEWQKFSSSKQPKRGVPKPEIEYFAYKFNEWLKDHQVSVPKPEGGRYLVRLPTLAEWEFAARGGDAVSADLFYARYPYDESKLDMFEWNGDFNSANGLVQDVLLRKPNPLGLYDMVGNVREIIRDRYTIDEKDLGYTVMGSDCRDPRDAFAIKRTPKSTVEAPGERVGFRLAFASELLMDPEARKQREQEAFAERKRPKKPTDNASEPEPPRTDEDLRRLAELERQAADDEVPALLELAVYLAKSPSTRARAYNLFWTIAKNENNETAWDGAEKVLRDQVSSSPTAAQLREMADFLRERNRHRWKRINADQRSGKLVDQVMAVACYQDREVVQLFERAADLGSQTAKMKLITALWEGDGVHCDPVRAENLLEQWLSGIRAPSASALAMKERMREEGDEVWRLLRESPQVDGVTIQRLRGALKRHALQRLEYPSSTASSIFSPGNTETKNATAATRASLVALWKRLLDERPCDPDLHVELGYCYQNGIGVKINYRTAFDHFQRAQNLGDAAGTFFAAMEFLRRKNDAGREDAIRCLDAAVQQSFPLACRYLGGAYLTGILSPYHKDFEMDHKKAEELFSLALSGGVIDSMAYLGFIYWDRDTNEEKNKALHIWREGASKGVKRCNDYLNEDRVKRKISRQANPDGFR